MRARLAEKYPDIELLETLVSDEDQAKAYRLARDVINSQPDLKGIWAITTVAFPGAAKAVRDAGKSGEIFVTGLSLPNTMREYVEDGTVQKVVLWNPVDLGYLTVHAAKLLRDGKLSEGRAHDRPARRHRGHRPAKCCSARRWCSIGRISGSMIFDVVKSPTVHCMHPGQPPALRGIFFGALDNRAAAEVAVAGLSPAERAERQRFPVRHPARTQSVWQATLDAAGFARIQPSRSEVWRLQLPPP